MSERIRNPLTGRYISTSGSLYKSLLKRGIFSKEDEEEEYVLMDEEEEEEEGSEEESDEDEEVAEEEEEEEVVEDNDLLVNLVDAACSVIANNLKKLSKLNITKRKKALKAMITRQMS